MKQAVSGAVGRRGGRGLVPGRGSNAATEHVPGIGPSSSSVKRESCRHPGCAEAGVVASLHLDLGQQLRMHRDGLTWLQDCWCEAEPGGSRPRPFACAPEPLTLLQL